MKKSIKLLLISLFAFVAFIICSNTTSQANSISKITMDIYVDQYGNAQVTEVWNCNTTKGTEVYHPYYNLGNSQITDIKVSEGSKEYTTLSSWNTSGSLSSKANKCGINKIKNGIELCWGISSYGKHEYTVKYNISNFVSELSDSQMIYWTLIPYDFSTAIGNVDIKIHSDSYIQDTIDVWGYGNYGGLAYVNNGAIHMSSDGKLATSEYMTILVKFPLETFNCENKLNYNFDHYFKMAEEGAEKYVEKDKSSLFVGLVMMGIFMSNFLLIIFAICKTSNAGKDFKIKSEDKIAVNKAPLFRDIPCNGDLMKAYYVAYQYGILKKKTDLLGAIILSWVKDGIVRLDQKEAGFIFKKNNTVVVFDIEKKEQITDSNVKKMFDMMYQASGDGILEQKEFEKWCSGKYSRMLGWFDTVISSERSALIAEGKLISNKKNTFFGSVTKYESTPELLEYAKEISGLKKFLLDYSMIKERGAIEVALFEDYMVYAQMMGIAKKVAKEFKDLYPDLMEQSNFNSYDHIMYINYCSSRGISKASAARAAAQSYSSGGGGFSSGGGGGGSFGGGGGRRRLPLKYKNYTINYTI